MQQMITTFSRQLGAISAVLLSCVLLAPAALANTLNPDVVQRWIEASKAMEQIADEIDDDAEMLSDQDFLGQDGLPDLEAMQRGFRAAVGQHRGANRVASRHGFSDAGEWADVGARITRAMMALHMAEAAPEMDAEMEQAMRELDESPHLSEQQRDAIRQQMQQAMGMVSQMTSDVPESDLAVVRDMQDELSTVFDMD